MGGGMNGDAIPHFVERAIHGKPLDVHGSGEQSSDFVYIDDVVDATIKVMESDAIGVFNVGGGVEVKLLDLARMIKQALESDSEIIVNQTSTSRPFRFCMDVTKARQKLDYSPVSIQEGIKKYIFGGKK